MQIGERYNPRGIFTGVYIPESLVKHKDISPGAKLAFGRLCWHVGEDGRCFPFQETLAEALGCSVRSVQSYLKELEDAGFIERIREGNSHEYGFCWHDLLEQSLKTKHTQDSAYGTRRYCVWSAR